MAAIMRLVTISDRHNFHFYRNTCTDIRTKEYFAEVLNIDCSGPNVTYGPNVTSGDETVVKRRFIT